MSKSEDEFNEKSVERHNEKVRNSVLEKLKLDLSVRSDNEHIGSGLGGNHSEFFFLISHNVKIVASDDDDSHFVASNKDIILQLGKPNIKQIRKELTDFIGTHPDKNNFSQSQLNDPAVLKDYAHLTLDTKLLLDATEKTLELASWLEPKVSLDKEINRLFAKEHKHIEHSFLKEMNLKLNYFEDDNKDYTNDPVQKMFDAHPVWSVKDKDINKRAAAINNSLLSQSDLENLKLIGTFPSYIVLFIIRSIIGIETLVQLNLDEKEECNYLATINKVVDI
jgi:hypothetical protein